MHTMTSDVSCVRESSAHQKRDTGTCSLAGLAWGIGNGGPGTPRPRQQGRLGGGSRGRGVSGSLATASSHPLSGTPLS
eukprot:273111-Rhodomonas_salina.1